MKNILITPEGIKTNLKNVKPLEAICEYIWNGFDAGASQIKVYLHTNELGLINMVSVIDNGTGIVYHELPYKFQPFNESKKAGQSSRSNHSLPHGRKGIGRLTFFSFAQMARWDTVYEKGGKKYQYYIDMNKDSLNEYDDNGGKEPVETSASVGTKVTFTQLITLSKDEIIDEIKNEFFWFIELNKSNQYEIWVDDELISYEDIVMNRIELDMKQFKLEHEYDVTFVQWNRSLGQEYSKFYFIDSNDKERYKEATRLNKKSDEFYHSIYIKSSFFDEFKFENTEIEGQIGIFPNKNDPEFKVLIDVINRYLVKFRKNYLKAASDKYIDSLIKKEVYPEFDKNNFMDMYRKKELDNLVETLYTAQPRIFSLQMIIAVGFKVNSERAVQFRKWVNQIAKDYTIKGWVMDDERLKRGTYLTEKYFDEQLERMLNCSHRLRWPRSGYGCQFCHRLHLAAAVNMRFQNVWTCFRFDRICFREREQNLTSIRRCQCISRLVFYCPN